MTVQTPMTFPEGRCCPGCGTLAYMGDNPDVCAACVQDRKPRASHEQPRLFAPVDVMAGQLGLEG